MNCNHCLEEIEDEANYYEIEVTAKSMGRPIPFLFFYCSPYCVSKDVSTKIKTKLIKDGDYE